jgi:hypothetical protein
MYRLRNRGLGAKEDLPQGILGTGAVDCRQYMTWLYTPECWKYAPSAWEQIVAFPRPTSAIISPPAAVDQSLSTVPAPYTIPEYNAAVDKVIGAGKAETDRNIADFFGSVPNVLDGTEGSIPWWMWAIGAGGLVLVAGTFVGGGSARRYGR